MEAKTATMQRGSGGVKSRPLRAKWRTRRGEGGNNDGEVGKGRRRRRRRRIYLAIDVVFVVGDELLVHVLCSPDTKWIVWSGSASRFTSSSMPRTSIANGCPSSSGLKFRWSRSTSSATSTSSDPSSSSSSTSGTNRWTTADRTTLASFDSKRHVREGDVASTCRPQLNHARGRLVVMTAPSPARMLPNCVGPALRSRKAKRS
eukprot:749930-Hanusia_phi.AAC.3